MPLKILISDLRLTIAALRAFVRENRKSCLTAALWAFGVPLMTALAAYGLGSSRSYGVTTPGAILLILTLIVFWSLSHLSLYVGVSRFLANGSEWRFVANLGETATRPIALRLIGLLATLLALLLAATLLHKSLSNITFVHPVSELRPLAVHLGHPEWQLKLTRLYSDIKVGWLLLIPIAAGLAYLVARATPAMGLIVEPRPLRRAWRMTRAGWLGAFALIFSAALGAALLLSAANAAVDHLVGFVAGAGGFHLAIGVETVSRAALAVGGFASTGLIAGAVAVAARRLKLASGEGADAGGTLAHLCPASGASMSIAPDAERNILHAGPMSAAGDISRALLIGVPSMLALLAMRFHFWAWMSGELFVSTDVYSKNVYYYWTAPRDPVWTFLDWGSLETIGLRAYFFIYELYVPLAAASALAAAGTTFFFAGRHLLFMGRTHPRRIAEIDRSSARLLVRDRFGAPLGRLAFAPDAIAGARAEPGRLVIDAAEAREPEILAVSGDPAGAEQAARIRAAAQVSETSWVIRTHGADAARPEHMLARTIETLRADQATASEPPKAE